MNLRKLRQERGLTQAQFWQRIGVTQSGGSRYETENRDVPDTVLHLVNIAHGDERTSRETVRKLRQ